MLFLWACAGSKQATAEPNAIVAIPTGAIGNCWTDATTARFLDYQHWLADETVLLPGKSVEPALLALALQHISTLELVRNWNLRGINPVWLYPPPELDDLNAKYLSNALNMGGSPGVDASLTAPECKTSPSLSEVLLPLNVE